MEHRGIRLRDADRLSGRAFSVLLLLACLIHGRTAWAVPGALGRGELDRLLPQMMEQADVPGMSVLMLSERHVSWAGNFGVCNTDSGEPVTADTTFFAASLSKPLFAYAVLRMVQRGELELDRPLCEYLPNAELEHDARYRKITARMVLCHSSGLPNWDDTGRPELAFEPGSGWRYSGEGFVYLQKVVEKLSGRDLNSFMQREVFGPLGMRSSSFVATKELSRRMATGHDMLGRPTKKPQPTAQTMNPAGTLITTAADYGRFMEAYLGQVGLSSKLAGGMSTAQIRPTGFFGGDNDASVYWGLGFGIENGKYGNTVWQWGDNIDYRNFVMVNPQLGSGIVILSNSENGLSLAERLCDTAIPGEHPAFDWLPFCDYLDPRFTLRHDIQEDYVEQAGRRSARLYADAVKRLNAQQLEELVISLGQLLVRDGHPADALDLLQRHAQHNAADPDAHDLLASFYLSTGRAADALQELQTSAKLDPNNRERNSTIAKISRQL